MRLLAGIGGTAILLVVIAEAFNTIVLARRVQSIFRTTRLFYRASWLAYTAAARRIRNGHRRENCPSVYGPFSLLSLMAIWAGGIILGFGLMQWAAGVSVEGRPASAAHRAWG